MRIARRLRQRLKRRGYPILWAGLVCLTGCDRDSSALIGARCQALVTALEQRHADLQSPPKDDGITPGGLLQPLNQWLLAWDNGRQPMRLLADLAEDADVRRAATQCDNQLTEQRRRLLASTPLLRRLNQLNLSGQPISTQHFVNKLRFQFLTHGATLESAEQEKLIELYQAGLEPSSSETIDSLASWFQKQQKIADILGFPGPLVLNRSQQMLPLNTMVRDYLRQVELSLEAEVVAIPEPLALRFEWTGVKQGLSNLLQTLFGMELVATAQHDPIFDPLNRPIERFQVLENGQVVGELILSIRWRQDLPQASQLDYFALQRGIAGGQRPRFAIAGDLRGDPASPGLSHRQLVAVLHQFGHFVHHQLASEGQWFLNAGLATEADFVEVPARLFEQWAWVPRGLRFFQRQPLSEIQQTQLATAQRRHRQLQRRAIFAYANDQEQWFASAATLVEPEINRALNLGHNHCLVEPAVVYRCLIAMDVVDALLADFIEFGFDDRQTATKLRQELLAPGGSRPALDMVEAYLNRSYALY